MDADDLFDWLIWGFLVFGIIAMALAAVTLILIGIAEVIYRLRRRGKAPLSTDPLPATIHDVPYKELPGSGGGATADDIVRDTCVICQGAYEAGEMCFRLPKCQHMFHKMCIAIWLVKRVTCPLCRAIVGPKQKKLNAAENMV